MDTPNLDAETMKSLLSEIKIQKEKTIYLIAYRSTGYQSINQAMSESKSMNQLIKDWLIKQSVNSDRIKTLSVGPLVPINSQRRQGNHVEILLLNDKADASQNSSITSEIRND
jgi:outer membrane protein OmpA-like peptidoglycan-associated protein